MDTTCPHCGSMIKPIIRCVTTEDGEEFYEEECPICEKLISEGS